MFTFRFWFTWFLVPFWASWTFKHYCPWQPEYKYVIHVSLGLISACVVDYALRCVVSIFRKIRYDD